MSETQVMERELVKALELLTQNCHSRHQRMTQVMRNEHPLTQSSLLNQKKHQRAKK